MTIYIFINGRFGSTYYLQENSMCRHRQRQGSGNMSTKSCQYLGESLGQLPFQLQSKPTHQYLDFGLRVSGNTRQQVFVIQAVCHRVMLVLEIQTLAIILAHWLSFLLICFPKDLHIVFMYDFVKQCRFRVYTTDLLNQKLSFKVLGD